MWRTSAVFTALSLRVSAAEQPPETRKQLTSRNRKVIHATCALHRGPAGFTNVVLIKRGGGIELDPHVTGSCVITFDGFTCSALMRHWPRVAGPGVMPRFGPPKTAASVRMVLLPDVVAEALAEPLTGVRHRPGRLAVRRR
jgi:hypothetical protein